MKRQPASSGGVLLASLTLLTSLCSAPSVLAATGPSATPVLVDAMDAELHRAMSSLGTPAADGVTSQQPRPYFLSYDVSDADLLSISAQYGAITSSNRSRRRIADIQVRVGTPAEDNTHGDHRNSALTTIALPITDDRAAIARTLWFATNRGYGKAVDVPTLKVKDRPAQCPRHGRGSLSGLQRRAAEDRYPAAVARTRGRQGCLGGPSPPTFRPFPAVPGCLLQHRQPLGRHRDRLLCLLRGRPRLHSQSTSPAW